MTRIITPYFFGFFFDSSLSFFFPSSLLPFFEASPMAALRSSRSLKGSEDFLGLVGLHIFCSWKFSPLTLAAWWCWHTHCSDSFCGWSMDSKMKTTAIGSPFSHFLVQTGLSPQTPAPFSGLCSDFEFAFVAMKTMRLLSLLAQAPANLYRDFRFVNQR